LVVAAAIVVAGDVDTGDFQAPGLTANSFIDEDAMAVVVGGIRRSIEPTTERNGSR
jgi:hypothetical protein